VDERQRKVRAVGGEQELVRVVAVEPDGSTDRAVQRVAAATART
jgi:hypothetical protein